jgi:hypothetical protein
MVRIIGKLAPLITGMVKAADGSLAKVTGEFNWLVRLPMLLGVVLLLVGLFAPVPDDKKDEVYEVGMALLVGGPVAYGARRRMKAPADAAPAAPSVVAAPPAPEPVEPPKTDDEAAKQIENL